MTHVRLDQISKHIVSKTLFFGGRRFVVKRKYKIDLRLEQQLKKNANNRASHSCDYGLDRSNKLK